MGGASAPTLLAQVAGTSVANGSERIGAEAPPTKAAVGKTAARFAQARAAPQRGCVRASHPSPPRASPRRHAQPFDRMGKTSPNRRG
ncbi:DUF6053 domain-containing protein [Lysobacter enzymogenes]|uniref:DUF6053 domain-containing protein n=1 Tax=Lysobacter enzymogenes TaxID=69 RepID=UPI003395E1FD